jgi:hypothetical protein
MNIVREVHDAVYKALKEDTELKNKVNSIRDKPWKNAKYPYITVGQFDARPKNTFGRKGREVMVSIVVYSKYNGSKEAFDIQEDVERILNEDLALDDNSFVNLEMDEQHSDTDEEPYIIYSVFRVVAQEGK